MTDVEDKDVEDKDVEGNYENLVVIRTAKS